MSLSTDVLAKATPTRLICRGGRWILELTRLEAVDRDVYQPRLTRLEGTESILAALRRSEEGQHLVGSAAQLMRTRVDDDRAFEVSEGDWVPSADAHSVGRNHRHAPAVDANAVDDALRAVAELRAELAVLRASHSRLRERVIALEASQNGLAQPAVRAGRGARPQRRRSEPPPAAMAEAERAPELLPPQPNAGFEATQASPPLVAAPAPVLAPLPVEPPPTFEALAKSVAGEQALPVLHMPSLPALTECLATLMGSAPQLEKRGEIGFDTLSDPHGCKLLDDDGAERGIILMDLCAAVMLGAALLALPKDEATRQVREKDPSEDALLAMSEICNNLTGPVNAVKGNAHVRSTALAAVDVSALPRPRVRLDLAIEGGLLVVAMY